jgi:predicted GIY-YIG superfamily endonuclease
MSNHVEGPHTLYRLYDDADRLVYVGLAYDFHKRMKQHAAKSWWWEQVATYTTEDYPTWREGCDAERWAIVREQPRWNIEHRAAGAGSWDADDLADYETAIQRYHGAGPDVLRQHAAYRGVLRLYPNLRLAAAAP